MKKSCSGLVALLISSQQCETLRDFDFTYYRTRDILFLQSALTLTYKLSACPQHWPIHLFVEEHSWYFEYHMLWGKKHLL